MKRVRKTQKPEVVKETTDEYLDAIFSQSQESIVCHDRLCQKTKVILARMAVKEFWADFFEMFILTFSNFNRSPYEERAVGFVAKFLLSISRTDREGAFMDAPSWPESTSEEDFSADEELDIVLKGQMILNRFTKFCVEHHDKAEFKVRYRCTQYLRKLLEGMASEATLSEETFIEISDVLLKRVWDKKAFIRSESIYALQRLQNPTSRDCAIVKAIVYMMRNDESYEVRQASVISVALTTRTLDHVLATTRDINARVRRQAFLKLNERSVLNTLSIAKRIQTLKDGLTDHSRDVRISCVNLLHSWLTITESNTVALLKKLDVEGEPSLCAMALTQLWEQMDSNEFADTVNEVVHLLDPETLCLKPSEVNGEAALLWRVLVSYVKIKKMEHFVEKITPSAVNLISCLQSLFTSFVRHCVEKQVHDMLDVQNVLLQCLQMITAVDTSDDFSRRNLRDLLRGYICHPHLPLALVKPLMKSYAYLEKNTVRMCDAVIEMITEIRDPVDENGQKMIVDDCGTKTTDGGENSKTLSPMVVESVNIKAPMDDEEMLPTINVPQPAPLKREEDLDTATRVQLSKMQAEIIITKGELETLISDNKFEEAAGVHRRLIDIQNQRKELLIHKGVLAQSHEAAREEDPVIAELTKSLIAAQNASVMSNTTRQSIGNDTVIKINDEESIIEKSDPTTLTRCNAMIVHLFNICPDLWKLTSGMRSLLETLIFPSIQDLSPTVRKQAVTALGLCCSIDKPLAIKYMNLFFTILRQDNTEVRLAALGSIIDCFLMFGLADFEGSVFDKPSPETLRRCTTDLDEDESFCIVDDDANDNNKYPNIANLITAPTTSNRVAVADDNDEKSCTTTQLLNSIISLLDSEESSLSSLAACGIAKLIMFKRIISVKLLSRLLLIYFNPQTEGSDQGLHLLLAHFFPKLIAITVNVDSLTNLFKGFDPDLPGRRKAVQELFDDQQQRAKANQKYIAQALLPTLHAIFSASGDSPLFKIDPWNVANLVMRLTDSSVIYSASRNAELRRATQLHIAGEENQEDETAAGQEENHVNRNMPSTSSAANVSTAASTSSLQANQDLSTADNPCHDLLAAEIAKEIIRTPQGSGVKVFIRILGHLRLSSNNKDVMKELVSLYDKIERLCALSDRTSLKTLKRIKQELVDRLRVLNASSSDISSIRLDSPMDLVSQMATPAANASRLSLGGDPVLLEDERPPLLSVNLNKTVNTTVAGWSDNTLVAGNRSEFFIGSKLAATKREVAGNKTISHTVVNTVEEENVTTLDESVASSSMSCTQQSESAMLDSDVESVDDQIKIRRSIGRPSAVRGGRKGKKQQSPNYSINLSRSRRVSQASSVSSSSSAVRRSSRLSVLSEESKRTTRR